MKKQSNQKSIILLFLNVVTFGCQVSIVFILFLVSEFKNNANQYMTSCPTNLTSTKRLFYLESYEIILKAFSIFASVLAVSFLIFFIKKTFQTSEQNIYKEQENVDISPNRNIKNKRTIKSDFTLVNFGKITFLFLLFLIAVESTILGKNFFVLVSNNSCLSSQGQGYSWKTLIILILASGSGLSHLASLVTYYCINFESAKLIFKSYPTEVKEEQVQAKNQKFLKSRMINLKFDDSILSHFEQEHVMRRQRSHQLVSEKHILHKKHEEGSSEGNFFIGNQNVRDEDRLKYNTQNEVQENHQKSREYEQQQPYRRLSKLDQNPHYNKIKLNKQYQQEQEQTDKYKQKIHTNKQDEHNNQDDNSKYNYDSKIIVPPYRSSKDNNYQTQKNDQQNKNQHNNKNKNKRLFLNQNSNSRLQKDLPMSSGQRMIQSQLNFNRSSTKRKNIFQNSSIKKIINEQNSYL